MLNICFWVHRYVFFGVFLVVGNSLAIYGYVEWMVIIYNSQLWSDIFRIYVCICGFERLIWCSISMCVFVVLETGIV